MEEEKKEEYYSFHEIAGSIKLFTCYVIKKWLLIFLAGCLGAGLGSLYYYFIQKSKYEAATTFILEEKSGSGSGLAGLASQFGIDVGGLTGGGSIFSGDNILEILKSKKIVQQVLLSPVNNFTHDSTTLADLYLQFTGTKKSWQNKQGLANINFANARSSVTPLQDSVLNVIYKAVIKKDLFADRISKKGTIIKVQVTAENEPFARLMTERLVEESGKLYLNIRTGTAQTNINRMQRRSDSLLALLNNKVYTVAASKPLDINPGLTMAAVPVEIATRDKSVITTLYTEVTKNLEASKMLLSQQTPVIQLLDKPALLLDDNKKSLPFLIVVCSFITIVLCTGFIGLLYFLGITKR
jgi:hypothetical protein